MGNAMRRYWIPAALSREVAEPDGPPVRVRLLGEDLVAFRDSEGRIGLMDELCPHRRASLYFGRNEECGLRCVYHGWKFDVAGACIDMMNEPPENDFKHKVRLTAYPTCELGGIIWAYLGPVEHMPPLPKFAWTQAPEAQSARDESDPGVQLAAGAGGRHRHLARADHAPAAERDVDARRVQAVQSVRARQGAETGRGHHRLWLPVCRHPAARRGRDAYPDLSIRPAVPSDPAIEGGKRRCRWMPATSGCRWMTKRRWSTTGVLPGRAAASTRTGWSGASAMGRCMSIQDFPFAMRTARTTTCSIGRCRSSESYTGIDGINVQDRAIQESMGRIVDRSKEHLGPADKAIIQARKLLRQAVKTVEAGGTPDGTGTSYYTLRAHEAVLPRCGLAAEMTPEMRRETILQTV